MTTIVLERRRPVRPASESRQFRLTLQLPEEDDYEIALFDDPSDSSDITQEKNSDVVKDRFHDLADWWHADTDAMSRNQERYQHRAYLRILGLGKAVVPYLLEDMRDNQAHWFDALRHLTEANPLNPNDRGQVKKARDAWLRWGKAQQLI